MLESIGRLKQRFSAVARHYEVTVEKAKTGPNATAVRFKRRPRYDEADEGAGAYVLRTSHVDWDIETVLRTYWRITDIEATFRSLKSELGLRPVWHQLDRRIAARLLIAVLACHAVHLIRTRLAARGIHKCWASIRGSMRTWVRVTTRLRQTDGTLIVNRQDTRPAAEVARISSAAGVEPAIHRRRTRLTSWQNLAKCSAMLESVEKNIVSTQNAKGWSKPESANLGIEDGEAPCLPGPGHDLQDRSGAVFRQRGLRLRSRMPAVRPQLSHLRRLLQHREDDSRRPVPVLHVGRVNPDRDREPLHVHRGVALPALDPLARAASRRAAHLRRLHRPAVDRGRRRISGAPRLHARKIAQRVHHALKNAVVAPRAEMVPNRRKGGKRLGTARHRHPVASMYRIASETARRSTVRRRPGLDGAGRSGSITSRSSSLKSLSCRSELRPCFSRAVPFQAMWPSLSGVEVSMEMPRLGETIHILGQPLGDALGNQIVAELLIKTVARQGYVLDIDRNAIRVA